MMLTPGSTSNRVRLSGDMRLGSLLVRLGLVSQEEVARGIGIGVSTGLPLGNVLIVRNGLTLGTLQLAVELQWMLKDGLLSENNAYNVFKLAARNGWTVADALIALGNPAYPERSVRLGDLLLKTNAISQMQLTEELELSMLTGLPLGRVIVARRRLAEATVWYAIELQNSIRAKTMEMDQAADRLAGINDNMLCSNIKLADLLVAAKRLSKNDVKVAVEIACANEKTFEDVLCEMDFVPDKVVDRAVSLRSLLRNNRINYGDAISWLKNDHKQLPVNDHHEEVQDKRSLRFYDFLKLCHYLSRPKLKHAVDRLLTDQKLMGELLPQISTGDPREDAKTIFSDYRATDQLLRTVYPEDIHALYCAKAAYLSIQGGELTAEEGLIKFFEVSRGTPVPAVKNPYEEDMDILNQRSRPMRKFELTSSRNWRSDPSNSLFSDSSAGENRR